MDAYTKGLSDRQAAWAARKYKGHHILLESHITDLKESGVSYVLFWNIFSCILDVFLSDFSKGKDVSVFL